VQPPPTTPVTPALFFRRSAAGDDDLEPETGIFADYGPPRPYDLFLRRAFFDEDHYRLCQLLIVPSFESESAVYLTEEDGGPRRVVSRTMKTQVWASMTQAMRGACAGNSFTLDAASQGAALAQLRAAVETRATEIDAASADLVENACRSVLLRVRYPAQDLTRVVAHADGTTYHAGHWIPGNFLACTTWSPVAGTLSSEFVNMELALKAYAEAAPGARPKILADLAAKARQVLQRTKVLQSRRPRT